MESDKVIDSSVADSAQAKHENKVSSRFFQRGFTLLELVISLMILSISFLAVIPLLMNVMSLNKTTDMATVARDLASQKVEELMKSPYGVIHSSSMLSTNSSFVSPVEYLNAKGEVKVAADADALYRRTYSINLVPGVAVTPIPVVLTAVVQYTYKGQLKSRSFTTMWSF